MTEENKTIVSFFILRGITDIPELQVPIFILILLIYIITLGGNIAILLLVYMDRYLHTPMYFFVGNLSIIDMCSISISLHNVLSSFISCDNTISFSACMLQEYIFSSLFGAEIFILTAMSYDRYLAICNPLQYQMVMKNKVCALLAFFSFLGGLIDIFIIQMFVLNITCFKSNIIDHFFCDLIPLMTLACSDTVVLERVILIEAIPAIIIPLSLTFSSYVFIITTILKIRSSTRRHKAFYTCSSHLTVVCLFYVLIFFVYLTPTSTNSLVLKKISSLINTITVPLLNPLIYSLKNKDVKSAFKRQLRNLFLTVQGAISLKHI